MNSMYTKYSLFRILTVLPLHKSGQKCLPKVVPCCKSGHICMYIFCLDNFEFCLT